MSKTAKTIDTNLQYLLKGDMAPAEFTKVPTVVTCETLPTPYFHSHAATKVAEW